MLRLLGLLRKWLLTPQVRLDANFPWSFGKSLKTYGVATLFYILGTVIPVLLFTFVFRLIAETRPEWLAIFSEEQLMLMIVGIAVVSFVSGFAAELWYISRRFKADKISIRKALALNLDSTGGKIWPVVWRSALAFVAVVATTSLVEHLLPVQKVHDPAAEFAKSLTGVSVYLFAFLGVVVAPIVEELVFRGFLYNMLRTSLRGERWLALLKNAYASDFAAALISATVFGLFHMNFLSPANLNWPALPVYMVTGMILAELYRRSGTLYAPILLHAMNNLAVVILTYAVS